MISKIFMAVACMLLAGTAYAGVLPLNPENIVNDSFVVQDNITYEIIMKEVVNPSQPNERIIIFVQDVQKLSELEAKRALAAEKKMNAENELQEAEAEIAGIENQTSEVVARIAMANQEKADLQSMLSAELDKQKNISSNLAGNIIVSPTNLMIIVVLTVIILIVGIAAKLGSFFKEKPGEKEAAESEAAKKEAAETKEAAEKAVKSGEVKKTNEQPATADDTQTSTEPDNTDSEPNA
ncbi:MAG: hypothetical protein ABIG30_02575 [Candidatus Aenigmatarchaeota archaeon]